MAVTNPKTQPQPQDQTQPQSLAEKLGQAHVGLRQDLEVHRLLFRGKASYVIRDPVSMQCYRANKEEYEIIININPDRTLADTFGFLVTAGKVRAESEEAVYEFVVNLHRMAFLQLPITDDKALFRRYQAKQQARAKEKFMAFVFLRIPLINPDYILNKTIHVAKHLFTRKFFYAWLGLMALAATVVILKRHELLVPLAHTFTGSNLVSLWVCLVLLKVFHEFGHSYACKIRGGYVPEMGIFLIAGTPCAYVDVTSSWAFPSKWDRIIVGCGGMYFESMIAALALFVWAFSESAGLQQLAHNIFIISGFMTVFMNINPLMRFDGYYILSDLIEVPNLRPRSQQFVVAVLKRIFLGIKTSGQDQSFAMKCFLFTFGVASSLYKAFVVLAISTLIATKAFLIGLFIGGGYIVSELTRTFKILSQYLWKSREAAHVRVRAVVVSILLFIGTPILFFGLPLPTTIQAAGQLMRENEKVVRAQLDGFIQSVNVAPGESVRQNVLLVKMENPQLHREVLEIEAKLNSAQIQLDGIQWASGNPKPRNELKILIENLHQELIHRRRQVDQLNIHTPISGTVIDGLTEDDIGRYVEQSQPVGSVASGRWIVIALLTEQEIAQLKPRAGQPAKFRSPARPGVELTGTIVRISPAGSHTINYPALTTLGRGRIMVDENLLTADKPYYELTILLDKPNLSGLQYGLTGWVRLKSPAKPLGITLLQKVKRFTNNLY